MFEDSEFKRSCSGAPEFDTKRCKWLIRIEASLSAATTARTTERLGWVS